MLSFKSVCVTRGGRPTATISSPTYILLIFSTIKHLYHWEGPEFRGVSNEKREVWGSDEKWGVCGSDEKLLWLACLHLERKLLNGIATTHSEH